MRKKQKKAPPKLSGNGVGTFWTRTSAPSYQAYAVVKTGSSTSKLKVISTSNRWDIATVFVFSSDLEVNSNGTIGDMSSEPEIAPTPKKSLYQPFPNILMNMTALALHLLLIITEMRVLLPPSRAIAGNSLLLAHIQSHSLLGTLPNIIGRTTPSWTTTFYNGKRQIPDFDFHGEEEAIISAKIYDSDGEYCGDLEIPSKKS